MNKKRKEFNKKERPGRPERKGSSRPAVRLQDKGPRARSEEADLAGSPDRLEGRNPIQEAIRAGRAINKVWVAKRTDKADAGLGRLIEQARAAGAVIMEVERSVLDQMAQTRSHQGIIAQVAMHEYADLDEVIARLREQNVTPFVLILDEVQDSYNLGSVLRIADAAGVHAVVIPQRRSAALDAAVAKASAGAIEYVPVCRVVNLSQTVAKLKEAGFWVAGAAAEASQNYRQADWSGDLALVLGSEGAGISAVLKKHCDFLVAIPMQGQVNSLNVAVAAGIIIFAAAAARQDTKKQEEAPV